MAKSSGLLARFPQYFEDILGIPFPKDADLRQAKVPALIFVSYLVTGYIGLHLQSINTFATLIWPPSGIAFAAYLMYGSRVWSSVFLAAFFINISIGAPLLVALGIAFGNTLGPLIGTIVAKWYSNYNFEILRLRDNIGIIASAFLFPVLTASIGVGSLWWGNIVSAEAFTSTWITWWTGDVLGALVCAPF